MLQKKQTTLHFGNPQNREWTKSTYNKHMRWNKTPNAPAQEESLHDETEN